MPYIKAFIRDRKGATAIEYGLIAGCISLAIVAAIFAFGGSLQDLFSLIAGKMGNAASQSQ